MDQDPKANPSASFRHSATYASRGISFAFRHEPNLYRQLAIGVVVVVVAFLLQIPIFHIALLIFVSGAVLTLELINSALEWLADAVHPEYNEKIRAAKDMSAGAVLLMSLTAAVVGLVILLPPILKILTNWV